MLSKIMNTDFNYSAVDRQMLYLSGSIVGTAVFMYYCYIKLRRKTREPKNWEVIGKVSDLYIYPLKSGKGIRLTRAECTRFGLRQCKQHEQGLQLRDRFLLVYRESDKSYCNAKTYPCMVLIEASVHDHEYIAIDAPDMRTLYVKIPNFGKQDEVFLWEKQKVKTYDCGDEAAYWFSRYILGSDSGLRLGYHDASEQRDLEKHLPEGYLKIYKNLSSKSTGLYADICSYLFVNESSVDELNTRLKDIQVTHKHFRPNIVIKGENLEAYDEDNWEFVKIGDDNVFKFVKYCPRCLVTNVDIERGTRMPGTEPLKTLKSYRKLEDIKNIKLEGQHPLFGSYFEPLKSGNTIEVGQTVSIIKR